MKIVYLAAGAAGMYCGSCLHDNTLAAALLKAGEDVVLVPTYTPIRTDEENVSQPPIFYGGVNVYLQQKLALFRHTPWFIDALFNAKPLMNWLSRRRASVDAKKLGDLTVSMLRGAEGNQRKEMEKLLRWLEKDLRPDVVHLSNTMLIGMAGEIRDRIGAKVVCSLAGEDIFLEELIEPYYSQARELLKQQANDADAFVALNRYYADFMTDYMDIDPARAHVVPHGLNLAGHATTPRERRPDDPFTIGYFARVCKEKGFHHIVEAFHLLARDKDLPPLRLRAAGYLGDGDKAYLEEHHKRLHDRGHGEKFEYLGEPDRAKKSTSCGRST